VTGDNGVRFDWRPTRTDRGNGALVQLLLPEDVNGDEFLDPRAAFCDPDLDEVWTQASPSKGAVFRVRKVYPDRYQLLLDRYPDRDARLFLPVNINNLRHQQRAVQQLAHSPLPHHAGLLRLCENPERVRWPQARPESPQRWTMLTDETRSGTDEQRAFVAKALGSPDLAILEGPPGSGKTTAICELIQQLIDRGERVLLCASTHVAIDNVLERLIEAGAPIDPVRVGRTDRVDETLQAVQLDQKVALLLQGWRTAPELAAFGERELEAMAQRTVLAAANLTCGTTMGIVRHPLFGDRAQGRGARPEPTMPQWDVLIVDEASKTLIQEFLVPALLARRWVIVGDFRQLPPFTERRDIVANLQSLVDERGNAIFPPDHQRARLLLFRLGRLALRRTRARWLIVEPPGVLDWLGAELRDQPDFPSVVRVVAHPGERAAPFPEVTIDQLRAGEPAALLLIACDWVLVGADLLPDIADLLPADLLHHRDLTATSAEWALPESHPLLLRQAWWQAWVGRLSNHYRERRQEISTLAAAQTHEQRWLADHDLAGEIAWRLTRAHELRYNQDQRERNRLLDTLAGQLRPVAVDIGEAVAEIQDIGLPSILEVLQTGIGRQRVNRPSALTEGIPLQRPQDFAARFEQLSYQHRMHPEISAFPRELIYEGRSLLDANTIEARDRELGWDFGPFSTRRVWMDVRGQEHRNVNEDEIRLIGRIVRAFLAWAERVGPPRRRPQQRWEVACLSFYGKQADGLSKMLREVSGDQDRRTRFIVGHAELACGTVDRFQGREADLVLLSMRNTRRIGFLDSRNRLNVAVTRARQQLVVVGRADNFSRCGIVELEQLVSRSHPEDPGLWSRSAR
jgi:hypothetical protein